jgi:hypothetical protein
MKHVTVLVAACALWLLACNENKGAELLGNACTPDSIPESASGKGFDPSGTSHTSSAVCGSQPCIVHHLDNGTDGGLPADPTAVCSGENPKPGCVEASAVAKSVHCTCRCDGHDRDCLCPNDYACREVLASGPGEESGSYCVRRGQ